MLEEDKRLINAARNMNQDALVRIFDLYSVALYRYSFRLCRDAMLSDQIVGDVFARLLEKFSSGNGPTSNLRSYLFETAYHLIVDESRVSGRYTSLEELLFFQSDGSRETQYVENRIVGDLLFQIMKNDLTKIQRHVIILRFMEGLSLLETARVVGKAVNNVKVIQNRAIKSLRKSLERAEAKAANRVAVNHYAAERPVASIPPA